MRKGPRAGFGTRSRTFLASVSRSPVLGLALTAFRIGNLKSVMRIARRFLPIASMFWPITYCPQVGSLIFQNARFAAMGRLCPSARARRKKPPSRSASSRPRNRRGRSEHRTFHASQFRVQSKCYIHAPCHHIGHSWRASMICIASSAREEWRRKRRFICSKQISTTSKSAG